MSAEMPLGARRLALVGSGAAHLALIAALGQAAPVRPSAVSATPVRVALARAGSTSITFPAGWGRLPAVANPRTVMAAGHAPARSAPARKVAKVPAPKPAANGASEDTATGAKSGEAVSAAPGATAGQAASAAAGLQPGLSGGPGDGSGAAARASALARYLDIVLRPIGAHTVYPHEAERLGLEGAFVVRIVVDRNGRVTSATVVGAAPHQLLLGSAFAALAAAQPLPPPPAELGAAVELPVPFKYRLDGDG